ncbi:hypothetical protein GCM10007301_18700 [Azorhizobium oxalatiphilum]|uniref:Uncharacterized protein n=1 Tax=Azorhizobium oxalatiphilum TaxID=980631 RepID=A0A917BX96_9HYPH|nr:hypothetical protein [Azorhizobium oxalatiphilum]GGF59210.1 hypothetical protein GCM10007301_18700 [Azorhizobium oxalatiphilum]
MWKGAGILLAAFGITFASPVLAQPAAAEGGPPWIGTWHGDCGTEAICWLEVSKAATKDQPDRLRVVYTVSAADNSTNVTCKRTGHARPDSDRKQLAGKLADGTPIRLMEAKNGPDDVGAAIALPDGAPCKLSGRFQPAGE